MSYSAPFHSEPNDIDMLDSTPPNSDAIAPGSDGLVPDDLPEPSSQPPEEKAPDDDEDDKDLKVAAKQEDRESSEEIQCKWVDCKERDQPTPAALVRHLNYHHLGYTNSLSINNPIRYTCLWEGCPRYGTDQPSRFALISHCRTHTGEKPYFCPIPECEKHFTRSDALAKHVKGVHDLHVLKDAVLLNRDRIKKGRMEPNFEHQENMNEAEFVELIEQDYAIRNPWWFSNNFLDVLSDEKNDIESIYKLPLDTKQYKVAKARYDSYINNPDQEFGIGNKAIEQQVKGNVHELASVVTSSRANDFDIDQMDTSSLQTLHDHLQSNLATANRINKIASTKLTEAVKLRRKLWVMNQILLDANASLSLPAVEGNAASPAAAAANGSTPAPTYRSAPTKDRIDDEIFTSIKSV